MRADPTADSVPIRAAAADIITLAENFPRAVDTAGSTCMAKIALLAAMKRILPTVDASTDL